MLRVFSVRAAINMAPLNSLLLLLAAAAVVRTGKPESNSSTISELKQLIEDLDTNIALKNEFNKHFEFWNKLNTTPSVPSFNCKLFGADARSVFKPTSVHQLRPGDIDVVAAIGDSITASCGTKARTAAGILLEWRGVSWSIGGDASIDEGVFTLPNMLKKFNPNLKGYSKGVIPVLSQKLFPQKTRFNVAVSGAKAENILSQAKTLVKLMTEDPTVDMNNDWKLVTLFIGGNDLCAFCKDEKAYGVARYQEHLRETLLYLEANLPRALVNVVMMLDLTQLSQANDGFVCSILHRLFCKCGSYPASPVAAQAMVEEAVEYSESVLDLLTKEESLNNGDSFTVVAQPFLVNQRLPTDKAGKPDLSYFAPDCFHFSARGHASSAQALWNNMFEPAGLKRLSWFKNEGWNCPTKASPYIFTYQNSGSSFSSGGYKKSHSHEHHDDHHNSHQDDHHNSHHDDHHRRDGHHHDHHGSRDNAGQDAKWRNMEHGHQKMIFIGVGTGLLVLVLLAVATVCIKVKRPAAKEKSGLH